MLYNILKDQWQTIEIDRIRSITQETEFSQMAELLYVIIYRSTLLLECVFGNALQDLSLTKQCDNGF